MDVLFWFTWLLVFIFFLFEFGPYLWNRLLELIELSTMLDASLHVERMRIDAINDRLKQLIDEAEPGDDSELARHEEHLTTAAKTAEANLQNYCKKQKSIDELKSLSLTSYSAPVEHISPTPSSATSRPSATTPSFEQLITPVTRAEPVYIRSLEPATTSVETPRKTYVSKLDEAHSVSDRDSSPKRTKAIDRQALYESQDRILSNIRRREKREPEEPIERADPREIRELREEAKDADKPRRHTFISAENLDPESPESASDFWKAATSPTQEKPETFSTKTVERSVHQATPVRPFIRQTIEEPVNTIRPFVRQELEEPVCTKDIELVGTPGDTSAFKQYLITSEESELIEDLGEDYIRERPVKKELVGSKPVHTEQWMTSTPYTTTTTTETLRHDDLEHKPIMETQTTSAQYDTGLTTTTVKTTRTFLNRSWQHDGDETAAIDELVKSGHITPPQQHTTSYTTETVLPPKVTTTTYTTSSPALRETRYNTRNGVNLSSRYTNGATEPSGPIMPLGERPKVDLAEANLTDAHIIESGGGAAATDADGVKEWDPTPMMEDLYKIEYTPKLDRKQHRFVNMEGHLEHLPAGTKTAVSERQWAKHYFKTKEGRLLMYQTTYADDMHALTDVLIAGCEITANRDDLTFTVHGGREHTFQIVRCPLALWDKWRASLISHAACSLTDSYVTPLYPPVASSWHQKTCIIEVGSASIRAGVMTNEHSLPQTFFPNLATVLENGDVVVGCEALKPEYRHKGTVVRPLTPISPGQERYTMNTPVMRCIIHHVFETLRITPALYNVLLTVPQNAPVAMIEDLMRILLVDMQCKAASVSRQPVLVLYAYDVTTGIVVDIGDRCNIVPVVDGYVVENAIVSLPYAGGQIKDALRAAMSEQKSGMYAFRSAVESYILRYVMEKSCYMAADYDAEVSKAKDSPNELETTVSLKEFNPTKEMISDFKLTSERFTSTEGLLAPKRWSLDCQGLQKLIYAAIQTAPMDSRRPLYRNIYVAGGVSQMPNFVERLETELQSLVAQSIQVNVSMSPWRYHAAYLGAQIVAASKQFTETLVTSDGLEKYVSGLNSQNF